MSFAATAASCPSCQPWEHVPGGPGSASGGSSQQRIEPVQRVRIVLFFDGTYNNKFNVAARKNGSVIKSVATSQASFANDESNVARMSDKLIASGSYQGKAYDEVVPVYIEGIGTTTLDEDSTYGGATGKGSTGILAKVEAGVTKALERLKRRPKAINFEFIHFDTFGFSRGAAAARNAVHRILNGRIIAAGDAYIELPGIRKGMTDSGFKVSDLKIRFVGLYDTVASFGVIHRFNTSELKLDSISAADQVIHLAAADEHRANFRLTDTSSKKAATVSSCSYPAGTPILVAATTIMLQQISCSGVSPFSGFDQPMQLSNAWPTKWLGCGHKAGLPALEIRFGITTSRTASIAFSTLRGSKPRHPTSIASFH